MFVDLDWPLNASSLLSASAELLVSLIMFLSVDCSVWLSTSASDWLERFVCEMSYNVLMATSVVHFAQQSVSDYVQSWDGRFRHFMFTCITALRPGDFAPSFLQFLAVVYSLSVTSSVFEHGAYVAAAIAYHLAMHSLMYTHLSRSPPTALVFLSKNTNKSVGNC